MMEMRYISNWPERKILEKNIIKGKEESVTANDTITVKVKLNTIVTTIWKDINMKKIIQNQESKLYNREKTWSSEKRSRIYQ